MKNTYRNFALIPLLALVFSVTSCLKDSTYTDFSTVGQVIQFPDAAPGKATGLSFDLKDKPDTVAIKISQTGSFATGTDINVTLGISQAALDVYNANPLNVKGTLLPSTSYSFPNTVTIVAGKDALGNPNRTATFNLLIFSKKVPTTPGVNYVLPIGITGVPDGNIISGNYGAIMYNFYKNPYDGDYTSVGERYNFSAASDYGGWDKVANKPKTPWVSLAAWNFPSSPIITVNATISTVHVGNSNGGFGTINIQVDPKSNLVTIISTDATALNALVGSPDVDSTWPAGSAS